MAGGRRRAGGGASVAEGSPRMAFDVLRQVPERREDGQAEALLATLETAAGVRRPVILMHMQGEPRTMQNDPRYGDVVAEVIAFLKARTRGALRMSGSIRASVLARRSRTIWRC
jgi:dihydropteroate synthase